MVNHRNLAIMLSALVLAGAGLTGCDERNWQAEELNDCVGCHKDDDVPAVASSDFKNIASYSKGDISKASSSCKKADSCMGSGSCTKGVDYAACECAQNGVACHTYPACKGIGDCDYTCGEGDTCSWLVCAKDEQCGGANVCIPAALPDNEDYDGDGILNRVEKEHMDKLDPCNPDSDGDGVKDGDEDLNHDGVFQPDAGETDFADPSDKRDPASQEGILAVNACRAEAILATGTTGKFNRFHLAKQLNTDYKYYPDELIAETSVVRFETKKVVAFFGSNQSIIGTGQQVLSTALEGGSYVESSAFKASVPLASWTESGYKTNLQIVPNHSVDRYKYSVTPNGKSLQEIADSIAKKFDSSSTASYKGNITCSGNATLYLARSAYDKGRVYSGAIACDSDTSDPAVAALLDDVQSGTLVAPTVDLFDGAPSGGYEAYKDFVCQIEDYGKSSGKADFLWVIDNSGSMADELTNLSKTVELFGKTMRNYGIDFRVGITTTDAYLLDEDPTAYKAYDDQYNIIIDTNTYLNGCGFKQHSDTLKNFRGFLDILSNGKLDGGKQNAFQSEVTRNTKCNGSGKNNKNICGFGFEDGLRSGVLTLSRVNIDLTADAAPDYYSQQDKDDWAKLKAIKAGLINDDDPSKSAAENEQLKIDKAAQVSLSNDENTLLYVIWVSDEESRQFKEQPVLAKPYDSRTSNPVFNTSEGAVCRSGYKLEGGTMRTGAGGTDLDPAAACSPYMKPTLDKLISDQAITEDSSMEEIAAAYPDYADMLKYYIKQYQSFAQNREIVGFAFVGDAGRNAGGYCQELATCTGTAELEDGSKVDRVCEEHDATGKICLKCNHWNYNDPGATAGANYGLSYIHMARFLSSYYPDDPTKATKEGGKASICATDYNATVTTIAEDVVGRLGSHPLKGYPISPSIHVYRVNKGKNTIKELSRNASSDGWAYDASQNAITFKNVKDISITDSIAITYVIWKRSDG